MQDQSAMNSDQVRFEVGGPEDLGSSLLAFRSPDSLNEDGWSLLAISTEDDREEVVGVVRVGRKYHDREDPRLLMRLVVAPPWLDTDVPSRLLRATLRHVSEWGGVCVQIVDHISHFHPLSKVLKDEGFLVRETFDTFEADLLPLVASWHENNTRLAKYFKDLPITEVADITEVNMRAVSLAWSAWIGGTAEEQYDILMRALGGVSERITMRHSCVLLAKGQLIGIGLGQVVGHVLKIHAMAIAPGSRVAGLTPRILARMGSIAQEDGATVMSFEAGRGQPDTQKVARRIKAKLIKSSECLRYTFSV